MFIKWLGIGHVRMRMYRRILVVIAWVVLIVASFEYYFYKWTPNQHSKRVIVVVKTRTGNGPEYSIEDSKSIHSQKGKEAIKHIFHSTGPAVSNNVEDSKSTHTQIGKETTLHTTAQSAEDMQAEKDSKKRMETVDKVCQKLNITRNVLELASADRQNRKRVLQRFNVVHHILVNEKHEVLYCFIPKVGSSNMKRIFLVMEGLYPSVKKVNIHEMNREIVRFDDKKFTKVQREYMLKNFYKFMLVRDPFERLVSAYRNKWQNKRNIELHANLGKRIIEKYRYNNTKTAENGDDVSFTEYARYLSDNPPWEVNEHWMTYEELCRPCNVKYDFIGSIDTLARDVSHVIRQLHANETKYRVIPIRGVPALTKAKQTAASFLQELPRKYFHQLLATYKTDHELFGYPLPEYETLNKRYPA